MIIDLAKIQEEMSEHDYKIAKQIGTYENCPHCCTNGDNYGESCRHCGKQLKGYAASVKKFRVQTESKTILFGSFGSFIHRF